METRGVNCNNGQAQLTVDKGTASVSTSGAVRNKQDHQVKVPLAKEKQNPAPMAEKGSALAAASGLRQAPVLLTLFFLDEVRFGARDEKSAGK